MKRIYSYIAIAAMMIVATSCGTLVGASVGVSGSNYDTAYGYPPYYDNPLYWDNGWYPGIGYYPATGVYPGPVRPGLGHLSWNPPTGAVGNVRPPYNPVPPQPAQPVRPVNPGNNPQPQPNVRPGNSNINPNLPYVDINGSNPGLVTPPAGSGLQMIDKGRH